MNQFFKIIKKDSDTNARAGVLNTSHNEILTPVFMPVGTQATVKAIQQRELYEAQVKIILGNTYHLYLRPGIEVIKRFKGLHNFMNWKHSILTDSGGYQIFSLQELREISEEGVTFKSHIDGSKHFFTPEKVIEIQRFLGSDIMMVLDECTSYPCTFLEAKNSCDLSYIWAKRSKVAFDNSRSIYNHNQYIFGIGQGSIYPELRKEYLEKIIELNFDGYAIGGLSVGEPIEQMYEIAELSASILPENKPRYLMGVGTPENILEAISRGIDMFDCVIPTRNARNGQLFTTKGKINIKNSKYKFSNELIDEELNTYPSNEFTLGYLRHLFYAKEILALQIASLHNINFYQWLVRNAREKIISGEFSIWKKNIIEKISNFVV